MRLMMASRRLVTLVIVGLILTACGGDADEAANTNSETLAVITPTPVPTDASSPMPEATTVASDEIADERPATTLAQQDERSTSVGAAPDDQPATTEASSEEEPAESQVTLVDETSDDSWEKDLPPGPAPTAPPAPPSDFDSDGDGFYTFGDLEQAVNRLFPTYEWPESYQVTPDLMLSGFAQRLDDRWEAGYEYTLVGLYHVCAWDRAWLDAYREGDTALMEESLFQLQEVALENAVFTYIREDLARIFERAALGDPSLIQQYVDNSCASYEFLTPEAGTPQTTIDRVGPARFAHHRGPSPDYA